jgi:hypothetical protein
MNGKVVDTPLAAVLEERNKHGRIVVLLCEGAEVDIDPLFVDPDWYKVETATHCQGWIPRNFIALKE